MSYQIPLTSFVDYVLKAGRPKMTCARKIKEQLSEPYDPASDYYKRFREAVRELHVTNTKKSALLKIMGPLPESKKVNYVLMAGKYQSFLGAKEYTWFEPPRKIWKHDDLEVPINPELGLAWGGMKYIIKLYLKAEPPSKDRIASILALMKNALPVKDSKLGVLDVRNNKLFLFEDDMTYLLPLIEGEAQSLELVLNRLEEEA